jgi:hypothetical protein
MKAVAIGITALSLCTLATPASAEHWDSGWRHRHHHPAISVHVGRAYARACGVKVTKVYRSNGTVVTRRVRRCD